MVLARNDETPLHSARTGEVAKALLQLGADPYAHTRFGVTPLHRARDLGTVEALLAAGAKVNAYAANRRTPLHAAAARRDAQAMVSSLLDARADVHAADKFQMQALHLAEDAGVCQILVSAGADLDAIDGRGRSASDNYVAKTATAAQSTIGSANQEEPAEVDTEAETASAAAASLFDEPGGGPSPPAVSAEVSAEVIRLQSAIPMPSPTREATLATSADSTSPPPHPPAAEQQEPGPMHPLRREIAQIQYAQEHARRQLRRQGLPPMDWSEIEATGLEPPEFGAQPLTFGLYGSGSITTDTLRWPTTANLLNRGLFCTFQGAALRVAILSATRGKSDDTTSHHMRSSSSNTSGFQAVPPFTLANCMPIRCAGGAHTVASQVIWNSALGHVGAEKQDLEKLAGQAVRLHFVVENGALFSAYISDLRHMQRSSLRVIPPPVGADEGGAAVLGLCGALPLASVHTVRQLVRMGFHQELSKRAAVATNGGGLPAAAKWAQVMRTASTTFIHGVKPAAAGRWRMDVCLDHLDANASGYLLLAHASEPIELALVEEGCGYRVGVCVRGGSAIDATMDPAIKGLTAAISVTASSSAPGCGTIPAVGEVSGAW